MRRKVQASHEELDQTLVMKRTATLDSSNDRSLARLLLANRVRELADYPRPVTVENIGRLSWLFAGIARLVFGSTELFSRIRPGIGKQRLLVPLDAITLFAVRLLLHRMRFWRVAGGSVQTVVRNIVSSIRGHSESMRYYARPTSEITGRVAATHQEEPLIRTCLLLRVIRRHGACIELLLQRLKSGLSADETRRWLSFFLSEIHDEKAANLLDPSTRRPEAIDYVPIHTSPKATPLNGEKRSTLKYGVLLPTMFDSDVFRRSLLSLLHSDFPGEIVVVEEGNHKEKVCESFCSRLPVTYVKNPTWTGSCGVANLGINQMAPDTDVILFAHSDLLWPERWFDQYDRAWSTVFDLEKVGIIYLGVLELYRYSDTVLRELFLQGKYADLVWVLGAMRDAPSLMGTVGNIQLKEKDRGRMFGLSVSYWDLGVPNLKIGAPAVVTFLRRSWSDLGGFDIDMGDGVWLELVYQNIQNRMWGLQINNTPIIHLTRSDHDMSRSVPGEETKVNEIVRRNMGRFKEMHGLDFRALSHTYHTETLAIHADEITSAVNELRFSDIDYIFDELDERLNRTTLPTVTAA